MSSLGWNPCPQDKEGSGPSDCFLCRTKINCDHFLIPFFLKIVREGEGAGNRVRTTDDVGNEQESINAVYEK